jgi:hypothetical protein
VDQGSLQWRALVLAYESRDSVVETSFIIQVSCWHIKYVDRFDSSGILRCVSLPDKFDFFEV